MSSPSTEDEQKVILGAQTQAHAPHFHKTRRTQRRPWYEEHWFITITITTHLKHRGTLSHMISGLGEQLHRISVWPLKATSHSIFLQPLGRLYICPVFHFFSPKTSKYYITSLFDDVLVVLRCHKLQLLRTIPSWD
jgi:hypothetical protein